jgi:hypothetical protein
MDHNYTRWILVEDEDCFEWDDVVHDNFRYVILRDGSRVDVEPDLYKAEREAWNALHQK